MEHTLPALPYAIDALAPHLSRETLEYHHGKPIQQKEFDPIKTWWNKRVESEVCWKVDIHTIRDRNFDLDVKNPHKQESTIEYSSAELMAQLEHSFAKSADLLNRLKEAVR